MATIIYSIIRSKFFHLNELIIKRTVLSLKQVSKFINYIVYYIQIHVIEKIIVKIKNKENIYLFIYFFFFCLFIFMVFPILLHCRPFAKAHKFI